MINISNYGGGVSPSSQIKAMRVQVGDFKLYFSYTTLIGFETPDAIFVTNTDHSHTTSSHKYSIGGWRSGNKTKHYVPDKLLQIIVYSNLLKLPFKECLENVNLQD